MHLIPFGQKEPHGELPKLPADNAGLCPALLDDDIPCLAPLTFAHNVREFHPVRAVEGGVLWLGECVTIDNPADDEEHLYCTAGHDWALPEKVEFE